MTNPTSPSAPPRSSHSSDESASAHADVPRGTSTSTSTSTTRELPPLPIIVPRARRASTRVRRSASLTATTPAGAAAGVSAGQSLTPMPPGSGSGLGRSSSQSQAQPHLPRPTTGTSHTSAPLGQPIDSTSASGPAPARASPAPPPPGVSVPGFTPVTRSASRISTASANLTFIDAPGVVAALPDIQLGLSRQASRASRQQGTPTPGLGRPMGMGTPSPAPAPPAKQGERQGYAGMGGGGGGDVQRVPTDVTRVSRASTTVADVDADVDAEGEKQYPRVDTTASDGSKRAASHLFGSGARSEGDPEKGEREMTVEERMAAPFPDGGKEAWTVVLGGVLALFCGFGLTAALGGFQTYYAYNLLTDYTPSTIAWIPGTQAFVTFGLSAFTGSLFDRYGHRALVTVGTILSGLGLIILSWCTLYWQLFIVHVLLIGVGNNFILISPMGVVGQWFDKKRGLAFGASTGSVIWPLMIARIPQQIGFPWLVRIMGFLTLILGTVALLLLRTRLPPKPPGPFFYLVAFRRLPYCCVALSSFVNVLSFFSFLSFIGTFGLLVGLGDFAPYLLIIANSASAFGRISLGLSADFLGPYNVTTIATFIVALVMWCWLTIRSQVGLIIMAILIGYFSGAYVALQAPMTAAEATDMRYAGSMVGQVMVFMSVAQLVGAPIFGALLGGGTSEEQLARANGAIAFAASMMTAAGVLLFIGKLGRSRKLLAKV